MSSYLRVLRHRDFRYLFAGQSASELGDRVVIVALALYITGRTGSPSDLGLVLFAQSLPLVALLLFGGVWADRMPRQRIMIATDAIRAALHGLLAALIVAGAPAIWEIVVIEVLFGAARAFFQPAYAGLIPQTVSEELIADARALTESMSNLAFLVGPVIATVLVLGVGAWEAFALDAATFAVSGLLLMRISPRRRGTPDAPAGSTMVADLRAGWREVRSRRWVWATIGVFTGSVLCVYAQWYALAPRIARDVYGSAGVFGGLEAAAGVGAVVGAVAALRWRPRRPLRTGMLMVLAWPLNDLVFALGAPLPLVAACSVAVGFGFSLFGIWWETALARLIPPGALSRVSAWDWMGSLAFLPFGYLLAGPLASAFGARTVLGAGSAIGLGLLALGLLPRETRELSYASPSSSSRAMSA
ncbi:MAG TPA: MFS transporter [Solirubrobacteraceae bacterium]|nr:MFS transporter [Solirubrobacteraceae bacterium]